jgi:hypothetical protein
MSKRHQSSRRRTYGRRQHELHERTGQPIGVVNWVGETGAAESEQRWSFGSAIDGSDRNWPPLQGTD